MSHFFLPPVTDVLLLQFKQCAKGRVDAAQDLVTSVFPIAALPRPLPPLTCQGDCLQGGNVPDDPAYSKVLNGLALVARHAAIQLLDALLTWRKLALNEAARAGSSDSLRKRVCETAFTAVHHSA